MTHAVENSKDGKFESIDHFLEVVGRKDFQDDTGFKCQQVTNAKRRKVFPSDWYWTVRYFCTSRGFAVPEHLFKGYVATEIDGAPSAEDAA